MDQGTKCQKCAKSDASCKACVYRQWRLDSVRQLIHNRLNQKIVAGFATGRPSDRYAANLLIQAYRERFPVARDTWHESEWGQCDSEVAWCVHSNGRNAPGGRYKTQDGEWRYIGQGPIAAYVPVPKPGRPTAALPENYWNGLPFSIDRLRSLFRKGKRTQEEREIYDELALHVAANPCARAALARELQCDPKAVDRLKGRGLTLLEKLDETNVRLDEVSERLGLFLRLNEASQEADAILLDANSEDSV